MTDVSNLVKIRPVVYKNGSVPLDEVATTEFEPLIVEGEPKLLDVNNIVFIDKIVESRQYSTRVEVWDIKGEDCSDKRLELPVGKNYVRCKDLKDFIITTKSNYITLREFHYTLYEITLRRECNINEWPSLHVKVLELPEELKHLLEE